MNAIRIARFLSVFFVTFESLFAQGTYPLSKGNVWQFWDYDYLNGQVTWIYGWTTKVVGDTLMPDGKSYAVLFSDAGIPGARFMRQEGSKVYIGLGASHPDSSYVIYDFSKSQGDTVRLEIFALSDDTMLTTIAVDDSGSFFGQKRRYQEYLTESLHSSAYMIDRIAEGFGLVYEEMEAGTTWFLRGAIIDNVTYGTIISVDQKLTSVPAAFELEQNFPNPFNSSTTISFNLTSKGKVSLVVYNLLGMEVRNLLNARLEQGFHRVTWDGKDNMGRFVASGAYIYRAVVDGASASKVMTFLK